SITQHDAEGRLTDAFQATYLGSGTFAFTVDAAGVVTVNEPIYDDATQSQAPAGTAAPQTNHTDYNGLGKVSQTTNEYNGVTTSMYDVSGRLIARQYPDGTWTQTVYDAVGRTILSVDRFK